MTSLAASDRVRAEWLRRVQAEYTSAAVTQQLGHWLLVIGASPDLVRLALRIVEDEMEHARLSHAVYRSAGGRDAPVLAREQLELRRTDGTLEHDVARFGLAVFCLGETVAVPLFRGLRERCTVPVARRALDRVLVDEVRHRAFGWELLEWLLAQPYGADVHTLATAELPNMFARLWRQYGLRDEEQTFEVAPAERAWGLMARDAYSKALQRTLERDWVRRFGEHGIDARAAWAEAMARDVKP